MSAVGDAGADGETAVALDIPAEHHMIRLARLVASGLGSIAGFDIDAVEDLRIAVDEGCVWLIEEGDGTPLRLTFLVCADGAVQVDGVSGRGAGSGEVGALVVQIMSVACASHSFNLGPERVSFTLTSRAPARDPGGEPGPAHG